MTKQHSVHVQIVHSVLTKKVEGTQGDKTKAFNFTIHITPADPDAAKKYDIFYATNATTTADAVLASGAAGTQIALKDGQAITIKGLSAGDKYTIEEDDYTADGYTTKYTLTGATSDDADNGRTVTEKTTADSLAITFYNIKNYITPTGVILNVAPYVLMVVIAVAAAFVFLRKRREG